MSEEMPNNGIDEESKAGSNALARPDEVVSVSALHADTNDEEEYGPLTPEEFRSVVQQIDALGLTWTADFPPRIRFKDAESTNAFLAEEFAQIQKKYPKFPRELGFAIFYAVTGDKNAAHLLGEREQAKEKVAAISFLANNPDFRADFFFRHAIKVPYFADLDWEVVIKARERNVEGMPGIAYALLSLVFERPGNPFFTNDVDSRETVTVAVNEHLLDRLIKSLIDAREALQNSRSMAHSLNNQSPSSGENHGNDIQSAK